MAFELFEPPGFSDVPDSLLQAGATASGFALTALKDNASFGSVVPEVFYTTQKDGDTVPLPISPVDGYQYQRSECVYLWEVFSSVSGESGVPSSANAGLLWGEWYIEPNNGNVHSLEVYGTNSLSNWSQSHDGTLGVWTIGIRGRALRTLAASPTYTDLPASTFAGDNAAKQTNLTQLSRNAKLGSVQCEVIAVNPSNAPTWQPNTLYAAGSIVQPTGFQASGFWFVAANSGQSGALEPTWPGVWHSAAPIDDGSIVWNVAGAGFYNGQQVPFPKSPVDGYQYSSADQVVPFLSFISTQSMPIQKSAGVTFTSGNGILELKKSVVGVQPSNPVQGGGGGNPPGNPPTQFRTAWVGTLQNWTPQIAAPAAPTLSQTAGGTIPATTYYVKITYVSPAGESTPSTESNLAVSANNLLVVNSPAASGAATGYNVYASTSTGTEQKQNLAPIPLGTNWTETTETNGLDPGAAPPTKNTTGFVPTAAEQSTSPMLTPGSPTTGVGIVATAVDYYNSGTFTDGTCMVWCLCFRAISAMAAPGGAVFADMSTDWFSTGFPLRSDYMQDLNENAKFSILRPEIFLNTAVAPGTAVPVPTSPVDGYVYSRAELTYMWYFTDTGPNSGLLRDFTIFVDPVAGIVNTRTDYYRTNGSGALGTAIYGTGGLLVFKNMAAAGDGKPTVNVIVIARRQHETELQTPLVVNTGGSPAPPGPTNLIPNGDFDIWSIPDNSPTAFFGVADDWGVLQNSGQTAFFQFPGIGTSLYSQAISAKPAGTNLTQRTTVPPPGGNNLASIASMIIPIWPGGTYRYHFLASARAQFNSVDTITAGFYARIHLLGATSTGDPDTSNDTTFELIGTNLLEQPGTTAGNNQGGQVLTSPPAITPFDFTFTIPLAGATFASTSAGQSVLSQTLTENPAYLYVEFLLWDITSSGIQHQRVLLLDNVVLQDLTEGSTNLNQQGNVPTSGTDNSAFSYSSTTTSLSFWWAQFLIYYSNQQVLVVAAQGSSGTPAIVQSGLSPSTTYYVSARYSLSTYQIQIRVDTAPMTPQLMTQWSNADGYTPIFGNWALTTPSSGTGGGGGTSGGNRCFTGATRVKTARGWFRFQDLADLVMIRNECGEFMAEHIVHGEDSDETEMIPIGGGYVTPDHLIRWHGRFMPAGQIFSNVPREKVRGKLHTLRVKTEMEGARNFIVEGGFVAHNKTY